jgi:undecaprenyl-diphosphatase
LWTVAIRFVDVKVIGPLESTVGFSTINKYLHTLTGVHLTLYNITDWLGLVPIGFAFGFALFGLFQWIKRKHIKKVDYSILLLGGFYVILMAVYIFFEYVVINHRPVLINGILEASYPSSTTMLVMCVMPTAAMQLNHRLKHNGLKRCVLLLITAFVLFMVIIRLISGVHWFTDIVGGALFSSGFVMLYRYFANFN